MYAHLEIDKIKRSKNDNSRKGNKLCQQGN